MEKNKKNAGSEGAELAGSGDRGAVVLKPEPPRRGTFALLVPGDLCWDVMRDAGIVRLDFRPMTRAERREEHERTREDAQGRQGLARVRAEGTDRPGAAPDDEESVR